MAELVRNSKYYQLEKRVIFRTGEQHQFLLKATKKLKLSWPLFADKTEVHKRTLNDWRRERYSLPYGVFQKISKIAKLKTPKGIKIKDSFWYVHKGAKLGGIAVYKKYGKIGGDSKIRKQKWLEWWEKEGKYSPKKYFVTKKIIVPQKGVELAEFVGIMIGDGGITNRQIIVTLNRKTDKLYSVFVRNLIKELFGVKASMNVRKEESVVNITVSRIRLVSFCKSIGLKVGNKLKQNLDIPAWVKKDKSFKIPCLRGLVDTDGCFFVERHKINNKRYSYPRLSFVSYSKRLRASVFKVLKELKFSPKTRNDRSVQLENIEDIKKYFNLVGTHNPKHKERFKSFFGGVGSGYPKRF